VISYIETAEKEIDGLVKSPNLIFFASQLVELASSKIWFSTFYESIKIDSTPFVTRKKKPIK